MQIIIPVIIHNEKNTTGINVSFAIKLINHPSLPLIILWWKRVYVKTIKKPISPNPRKLSPKINFLILFISPSLFGIFTICSLFYSLLICSAMRSNAVKTTSWFITIVLLYVFTIFSKILNPVFSRIIIATRRTCKFVRYRIFTGYA